MDGIRVLELFSGIGGMHYALNECDLLPSGSWKVVAAVDINQIANATNSFNHPEVKVLNNNIQKLTAKYIEKLEINAILMSPPCQPFTRVGKQKDVDDNRTDALNHICSLIPDLSSLNFVLMENVKGFETSKSREMFIDCLKSSGFTYREFILSPTQLGVPNTRNRYYCLAKRKPSVFQFGQEDTILQEFPSSSQKKNVFNVETILESSSVDVKYSLPENLLSKRAWLLDIVYPDSVNTNCFTKAYTHYIEGTGSVLCKMNRNKVEDIFNRLQNCDKTESINLLKTLELRFFTPREVARLMSFPEHFKFSDEITQRQQYRLLGNSINVLVVCELIKLLFS